MRKIYKSDPCINPVTSSGETDGPRNTAYVCNNFNTHLPPPHALPPTTCTCKFIILRVVRFSNFWETSHGAQHVWLLELGSQGGVNPTTSQTTYLSEKLLFDLYAVKLLIF